MQRDNIDLTEWTCSVFSVWPRKQPDTLAQMFMTIPLIGVAELLRR